MNSHVSVQMVAEFVGFPTSGTRVGPVTGVGSHVATQLAFLDETPVTFLTDVFFFT